MMTPAQAGRWRAAYVTYAGVPPVPVANVVEVALGHFTIKAAGPGRRPTLIETDYQGTLADAINDAEATLRDLGWKEADLKSGER